jgi:uncharacterized protein involved in type VI secretion and phage assembly
MNERVGVVTAFVREVDAQQGRIRVEYRGIDRSLFSPWAYVAAPLSGRGRGALFMPEPGDEVLICFGDGDFGHPYAVGYLWNGEQTSPETEAHNRVIVTPGGHQLRFEDKANDTRIILKSKGNHLLTLEDKAANPRIELKTNSGREVVLDDTPGQGQVRIKSAEHQITMNDTPGGAKVEIRAGSAAGVTITMNTTPASLLVSVGTACNINISDSGLTLSLTGQASITTAGMLNVTAAGGMNLTSGGLTNITTGLLNVTAGLATFSGVVQTSALITNAVISPVYTPGAGNLL